MAHPGDPFSNAQLTPEEADRLALMFRPSWELDEAPFTGPGSLSPSEIGVLQGGGVRQDVRAATLGHGSNGAHPEPSVVVAQDADRTIVERAATAQDAPPSVPAIAPAGGPPPPAIGSKTIMGIQAPILAPAVPSAPPGPPPAPPAAVQAAQATQAKGPPSRPSQRPSAPTFDLAAKPRAVPARPAAAVAVEAPSFRKKPSMGLWIGVGAGAVMLVALGIYAVSSGGEKPEAPAASADKPPVEDKLANVPPPPPPATAAVATTVVGPPPPPPG
jgi:hypothetical protein